MNKDLNPSIDYQLRTNLNPVEPSDFVTSITGDVSVYSDDGPEEEPVIAKVHYYHLAQMEQELRYSAWETLEGASAETEDFCCLYVENSDFWTDEMVDLVSETNFTEHSLLIINSIQILPAYRGQGLTRALIADALRTFAPNTDVLALKCSPLQLDDRGADRRTDPAFLKQMGWDQLPKDPETACARLQAYYERLGFRPYNEVGVMVAGRSHIERVLGAMEDKEDEPLH